jgi:hypothetical protein
MINHDPITMPMNAKPRFQLQISPQKELELLNTIASGLAASGCFIYSPDDFDANDLADNPLAILRTYGKETPGPDGTTRITGAMLLLDVAEEIFSQLRRDVEQRVEDSPELYSDVAVDELPTE